MGRELFSGFGSRIGFAPGSFRVVLGLCAGRAGGDLSGMEEARAVGKDDCAEEHSLRDAGDEVLNILLPGERRHGTAEGVFGFFVAKEASFPGIYGFLMSTEVSAGAASYGWVLAGRRVGIERCRWRED